MQILSYVCRVLLVWWTWHNGATLTNLSHYALGKLKRYHALAVFLMTLCGGIMASGEADQSSQVIVLSGFFAMRFVQSACYCAVLFDMYSHLGPKTAKRYQEIIFYVKLNFVSFAVEIVFFGSALAIELAEVGELWCKMLMLSYFVVLFVLRTRGSRSHDHAQNIEIAEAKARGEVPQRRRVSWGDQMVERCES